jgi:glycosyltransferase involved in cell wall biosynthesis
MGRDPAVSVLLPVRDAARTLEACLRSVARQSMDDWECVIVDDGSTDASGDIAAAWQSRDPRFRAIRTPPRGIVGALNDGIERARGAWIARLDGDDLMHRERLEMQLSALERQPGLAGTGSHVRFFPRAALGPGMREYETWIGSIRSADDVRREVFVECPVPHPTLTISREVLVRYRYRDRGWPEDYDLVLRLLRDGHTLANVPRRLVSWRRAPWRLSSISPVYAVESFVACKAHHLARSFLRNTARYLLWGYGRTGRLLAAALEGEGRSPAGIVEIHPGRIGNVIRGVPVFHFDELRDRKRMPIVVSVAGTGPRGAIRGALAQMGFVELRDFVCAA